MISEGRKAPDLGMPSQAGNNLLWNLTRTAKNKRELLSMIDKLAQKLGGKYKDAKDELITRAAVDAFDTRGNVGHLANPDRNVMQQIKSIADLGDGEIKLQDKTKVKMDGKTANKVLTNLMKIKPQVRGKVLIQMQKTKSGFEKMLKVLNR
jgi:hypothetical protein